MLKTHFKTCSRVSPKRLLFRAVASPLARKNAPIVLVLKNLLETQFRCQSPSRHPQNSAWDEKDASLKIECKNVIVAFGISFLPFCNSDSAAGVLVVLSLALNLEAIDNNVIFSEFLCPYGAVSSCNSHLDKLVLPLKAKRSGGEDAHSSPQVVYRSTDAHTATPAIVRTQATLSHVWRWSITSRPPCRQATPS